MTALPGNDPSFRKAQNLIATASRRLRARHVVRWATTGAWAGIALCALLAVGSRFYWPIPLSPGWLFPLVTVLAIAAGAVVGMLVPSLTGRDLLAFTDKAFGIDELLLTTVQMPDSSAKQALSRALDARLDAVRPAKEAVPIRRPAIRALGLLGALAIACLFLPYRAGAIQLQTAPGAVGHEGERLEERLGELDRTTLPPEISGELDELVADMKSGALTDEEATARIEAVQNDLDDMEQSLEPGASAMKDLEEAANALSQAKSAEALADAIEDGDLDKAARAAMELSAKVDQLSPEERQKLGEALKDASKRLEKASPELQQAAQAMNQAGTGLAAGGGAGQGNSTGQPQPAGPGGAGSQGAGQNGNGQTANGQGVSGQNGAQGQNAGQNSTQGQGANSGPSANGQNGANGQSGQPGTNGQNAGQNGNGQPNGNNGQSPSQGLNQLADELQRNQALAQQMKNDQRLLQQSQKVNGAMQAAQNRLQNGQPGQGGKPGQSGQPGQGAQPGQTSDGSGQGDGQGQGNGQGTGASQQPGGSQAGSGHTWLDQGTTPGYAASGHQDENRQSNRTSNKSVDDFKQLYAPVFDPTHQGLMAGVSGTIDESGHIDEMPTRLTNGQETASTGISGLPGEYKQAADQAMNTERVPPGYRDAVRNYFGDGKSPAPEK